MSTTENAAPQNVVDNKEIEVSKVSETKDTTSATDKPATETEVDKVSAEDNNVAKPEGEAVEEVAKADDKKEANAQTDPEAEKKDSVSTEQELEKKDEETTGSEAVKESTGDDAEAAKGTKRAAKEADDESPPKKVKESDATEGDAKAD